jgi:hypothetical protein
MATFEAVEFIECSVTEAFALLSQPDKHPLWQTDLESDWIFDGDGGVGSRGREVRRFMGRLVVTEYEVTEFTEAERWGMRSVSGPLSMSATLSCAPSGTGTTVTISMSFSGWSGEAMARLAKQQSRGHLRTLKNLAEADRSADQPAAGLQP